MKAKLIALAVLVALAAIPMLREWVVRSPYSTADIAAVLPRQVGAYRAVEQWNVQPDVRRQWRTNRYECGAVYSRGRAYPTVRVDLLIGSLAAHNPLQCRLFSGAATQWSRLETVATSDSNATMEISLAREAAQSELIASSECYASGCTETAFVSDGLVFPRLGQVWRFFQPEAPVVIPVAIVVSSDQCGRRDCAAELLRELDNFLAIFDLGRIQRFAAKGR
jgi:hypothetical protein